jgi:sialate O-acetylesterase
MTNMKKTKSAALGLSLLAFASVASICAAHAGELPLLHEMFQDHAVLQRGQPIPVWGNAQPNAEVKLSFAGKQVRARADAQGRWKATLPAQKAGGPYTLTAISGARTQTASDVLVGDVWLCSGQSNMELQVKRTLNSRAEIADAGNDRIRLLKVGLKEATTPREHFPLPVQWQKTTPENVPEFSATCYYFARELQKTVDVPMGLVNSSWGGSRIETWISADGLRKLGGFDAALDVLALYASDPHEARLKSAAASWGAIWSDWWRANPAVASGDEPWNPASTAGEWRAAPTELGPWESWGVPELADYNGMVWYRTTLQLTAEQAAQPAVLELGAVDEVDMTWVNGVGVGSAYIGEPRKYPLPRGLLKAGANTLVVNALDTYATGGIIGPSSTRTLHFADGSSIPLDGAWQYRVVPADVGSPPLAPWMSAQGKTTLFNGMIAPLAGFGLRGAVWYQGESNTGDAEAYRGLLRSYRDDLRAHFGKDLPLLVVQLPNYGTPPTAPGESGWASLREVQREVVAEDPRSGMAVTIDIGDRSDLHPANKQEVGRRLARAARHVIYGEELVEYGPVPAAARREGDAVVVSFGDVTGKLVAYGDERPAGFELCGAEAGSCRYASAQIRGNDVVLRGPVASPTRVRHAWADSPVVTLFDANGVDQGLPAGPFEIAIH